MGADGDRLDGVGGEVTAEEVPTVPALIRTRLLPEHGLGSFSYFGADMNSQGG
jgi:hypothetical protein